MSETKIIMPTREEIVRKLNEVNSARKFVSFYNEISKCAERALNLEGVMMVFNLALMNEKNSVVATTFEAAPRRFIEALIGHDDQSLIEEVVRLLKEY